MNLFKRNSIKAQKHTPATKAITPDHVSKKKKNTYEIALSGIMCDISCFRLCPNTPLAIVTLNGKKMQESTGFLSCTQFPNPFASEMQAVFTKLSPLDKKTASTIIEYLDKATDEPVLLLFPHGMHIKDGYKENYLQHLNHASRRDLVRQIAMREKLLAQYQENQKQK